jgi:uncharacterized protein (DUF433 family)
MGAGETSEQLFAAYPQLKADDLNACIQYAAASVGSRADQA